MTRSRRSARGPFSTSCAYAGGRSWSPWSVRDGTSCGHPIPPQTSSRKPRSTVVRRGGRRPTHLPCGLARKGEKGAGALRTALDRGARSGSWRTSSSTSACSSAPISALPLISPSLREHGRVGPTFRLHFSRKLVRGGRVRVRRITQNHARRTYPPGCVEGLFSELCAEGVPRGRAEGSHLEGSLCVHAGWGTGSVPP